MSVMLTIEVGIVEAPRVAELLVEAGFSSLVERELDDRVEFDVGLDDTEQCLRAQTCFSKACAAEHIAFELRQQLIDDSWRLAWTEHLRPVRVSDALTIVPEKRPQPTAEVGRKASLDRGQLYLEPELAFGFAEHPTTLMLLRWLEHHSDGLRVLDMGTGTGVLALAAAHFGAERVVGVDIDPVSVRVAQRNAEANGLSSRCEFMHVGHFAATQQFDLVAANIDCATICGLASTLRSSVGVGGSIALTGLLIEQEPDVNRAFLEQGCVLNRVDEDDGWVLLSGSV